MKDLNLVPKSYIEKKKRKAEWVYITIVVIIMLGVFSAFTYHPYTTKNNLNKSIKTLETQINSTRMYLQIEEEFNVLKKIYNDRVEEANKIFNIGINYIDVINSIERSMPEKLFIVSLSTETNSKGDTVVSLLGICESYDDIASFVRHLKEDNLFSDVYLTTVTSANNQRGFIADENTKSTYSFNINLPIMSIRTSIKGWE
ncbi:UNVERIFIED_CONTAM: fimbrial assembly protein PilN [Acetivibrio alkalicellulosi]